LSKTNFTKDSVQRQKAAEKQLQEVSTENGKLKRLLAYKKLELVSLRELRDSQNPRQPIKLLL